MAAGDHLRWTRNDRDLGRPNGEVVEVVSLDAEKVKGDKHLPFGLPGVNKANKVSNANCLRLS